MKSTYHTWLDLQVNHTFFTSGKYANYKLVSFPETARMLTNYNIMISQDGSLNSFYAGNQNAQEFDIQTEFAELPNLYFQLLNEDLLFYNYTDIPFKSETEIFYFENGINTSSQNLVQQDNFVSEKDFVSLRSNSFNISLPKGQVSIEVKTKSGNVIAQENVTGVDNYLLKLGSLDEGLYELWINGQQSETFFLNQHELDETCIGVFCLNISKLLNNPQPKTTLDLSFDARSAFLQYQVVVPENRKIEVQELSVIGSNGESYEGPQEQQIIGKQTAQTFTSKESIQLQSNLTQSPQLKMTYANDYSNRYKQLNRDLPNPNVEEIRKYEAESNANSFLLTTIIHV